MQPARILKVSSCSGAFYPVSQSAAKNNQIKLKEKENKNNCNERSDVLIAGSEVWWDPDSSAWSARVCCAARWEGSPA